MSDCRLSSCARPDLRPCDVCSDCASITVSVIRWERSSDGGVSDPYTTTIRRPSFCPACGRRLSSANRMQFKADDGRAQARKKALLHAAQGAESGNDVEKKDKF